MDPKPKGSGMLLAPARGGAALSFPSRDEQLRRVPPVDEHIVKPEVTRDEVIRGRKVIAAPALDPHADVHAMMSAVIRWHVRDGYQPSVDLLTRVSEGSDFATDVSVRKAGVDPATGRRYLEELSFEIVNEQKMRDIREKAEDLAERGVRRIFGIYVKRGVVAEWSREKNDFVPLELSGFIEDSCFVRPMAVRALLDGAVAEAEVIAALERKKSPAMEVIKARALEEGIEKGILGERRSTLLKQMQLRFGELPEALRAEIDVANAETLARWLEKVISAKIAQEVVADDP